MARAPLFFFIPSLEKDRKFIKVNAIKFPDGEVAAPAPAPLRAAAPVPLAAVATRSRSRGPESANGTSGSLPTNAASCSVIHVLMASSYAPAPTTLSFLYKHTSTGNSTCNDKAFAVASGSPTKPS